MLTLLRLALALGTPSVAVRAAPGAADFGKDVKPFLADFCTSCHGVEKKRGEVDFERFADGPQFGRERELWEKARDALESREMPPENKRQPDEALRQRMIRWIDDELARLDAAAPPSPGRVTARRLNRNEYRNTIRDLLGVDYDVHAVLPNDESGYGFDNIGDVLSLSPMLLEKYLAAAEELSARAIITEDPALKRVQRIPANRFSTKADAVSTVEEEIWGFYREGEIVAEHTFSQAGEYRLRLKAYGEQAGRELPKLAVRVDGKDVRVQEIKAQAERPETFDVPIQVEAGGHRLAVAYLNNFNSDGDRNVFLASFEVLGPMGVAPEEYPETHRRILPRRPTSGGEVAMAREALSAFAARAYRRPPTETEVGRLVDLFSAVRKVGASFEEGIRIAVQAVLVSPHFLYRWELDDGRPAVAGIRDLNGYEIASRLSYFLWSSMPDATLFDLAGQGELTKPAVIEAQVRRMLADSRTEALVQNFGGQWLQIRNLDQVEPDTTIFPQWDGTLRDAMRREAEMFFAAVIREDRSVQDLLDADFTFVNERLARHYGLSGVSGAQFQRVTLPKDSGRGGVLTMGGVLTITSVPTRTAPVLRGKWILEQILGTPPPPPPPNVPPVEVGEEATKSATLRQRLELHRSKPDCIACHQKMDPLGFALENFDAIGRWRDADGPHPIDAAAELPGGRKFTGAPGLKAILRRSDDFPRALTRKLLTYGLGRGIGSPDRRAVQGIVERMAKTDFKFSELLVGVALSDPFLKRQPEPRSHEQHASLHP